MKNITCFQPEEDNNPKRSEAYYPSPTEDRTDKVFEVIGGVEDFGNFDPRIINILLKFARSASLSEFNLYTNRAGTGSDKDSKVAGFNIFRPGFREVENVMLMITTMQYSTS